MAAGRTGSTSRQHVAIKLLIDMNLSPRWAPVLSELGWPAVHWSDVGEPRAVDETIMAWAAQNDHVVFTHDLDFGAMLADAGTTAPSVLQVRARDVLPQHLLDVVAATLTQHEEDLASGALVVVDESRARVRLLPIQRSSR